MFRFEKRHGRGGHHHHGHRGHGKAGRRRACGFGMESLEGRQLLHGTGFHGGGPGGFGGDRGGPGSQQLASVQFGQTPAAVQSGLDALAEKGGLADPAATAVVSLGNVNGVETYSVTINGTGTVTRLTVDANGNPVTAPTVTTSDWGTLSGSGTGSNAAASAEIAAIATVLGLTAPASTTAVRVVTASDGSVTYSVTLDSGSTTGWHGPRGTTITVDGNGNPVGNQVLPFGVMPATVQNALNANVPSGGTALEADSTQSVRVQTVDGVTLYSTTFTADGTSTTVTVNAAGALTSLPSTGATTFGALSSTVQAALQAMATAGGATGTLAADQSVTVLNEANGTTIYSVSVDVTTAAGSTTRTRALTVSVDADGNPTVAPMAGPGGERGPGGGGCGGAGASGASSDDSASASAASSTAVVKASSKKVTTAAAKSSKVKAAAKGVKAAAKKVTKKLARKVKAV